MIEKFSCSISLLIGPCADLLVLHLELFLLPGPDPSAEPFTTAHMFICVISSGHYFFPKSG